MGLLDRGPAACRRDSSCEVLEPIRASRPEDHGCAAVREQEGRRGADTTARAIVTSDAEFTLHAVARQTGVGQGTLYRNFLAHEDLLAEVYRRKVDELVEAAERLLIVHEPGETLAQWLDGVMQYATVKRGVLAAVEASLWQDLTTRSLGPIGGALTRLLNAGKDAGVIRADADDVILLLGAQTRIDCADYERPSVRFTEGTPLGSWFAVQDIWPPTAKSRTGHGSVSGG